MNAVIFDMDGVIADTETVGFNATKRVLGSYKKTIAQEFYMSLVGKPEDECRKIIVNGFNLPSIEEYKKKYDACYFKLLNELQPNKGLKELLNFLRNNNYKIALASGSGRKKVDFILNHLGITDYFDVIISGNDTTKGKPHPDAFIKTVNRLNIPPQNCLIIEDSLPGIEAANRVNIKCIALNTPFVKHNPKNAHLIIDSLEEINPEILNLLNFI